MSTLNKELYQITSYPIESYWIKLNRIISFRIEIIPNRIELNKMSHTLLKSEFPVLAASNFYITLFQVACWIMTGSKLAVMSQIISVGIYLKLTFVNTEKLSPNECENRFLVSNLHSEAQISNWTFLTIRVT